MDHAVQQKKNDLHHPPQGSYFVLRVADLETSAKFFTLLGFSLTREKHGNGPEHFSFSLQENLPCELYPWSGDGPAPKNSVRLGVLVPDIVETRRKIMEAGVPIIRESSQSDAPAWMLVTDPNGNQVEITAASAHP